MQTGPFGSQLHQSDYQESGVPVIMPADILDGKIDLTRIARVSESHVDRLKRHKLSKGDIVYGRRGDIGRQALIRDENTGWLCGTGCLRVTLGDAAVESEFLHRYLQMPEVIGWIQNQAIGATMPNLNTAILRRVPVLHPRSIEAQKKIAAILSAYDDLIENNKSRIALLEKMAEEIYCEWFVRMRFPGHEKVKFVKGVPEGWEVRKISQVYQTSSGGTPSRKHLEYYGGVIPWVKTGELGNSFIFDTEEHITSNGLENSSAKLFPQKTIIIAMYGATIGELGILAIEATTNQACCALQPENSQLGYTFTFHLMKSIKDHLISFAFGGAQQNISQELIKNFQFLLPSKKIVEDFCNQTESIYSMIEALQRSRAVLEKARSSLLPRLISGKLSVEDLDIHFPPSMQEPTTTEQLELDFTHA